MRFRGISSKAQSGTLEKPHATDFTILVTGTTGSLGTYILDALLATPSVKRIIAFNRSNDASERQVKSLAQKGLSTSSTDLARVEFIKGDLSQLHLGLSQTTHDELLQSVTHILHNAWPVNFNTSVASFEPHITGVRNLITFAHNCTYDATLFFVSSVSVAANWSRVSGNQTKVPEIPIADWRAPRMGYGQSKLISERLLEDVAKFSGRKTVTCRVGQIAGPIAHGTMGSWNKQEWVPSLIASSQYLGKLPTDLGPASEVDWVPVDVLGRAIVELLMVDSGFEIKRGKRSLKVYHAVNPSSIFWRDLIPSIQKESNNPELVSFPNWVTALRASIAIGNGAVAVPENPATKLLEAFFDNLDDKARRFPDLLSAPFEVKKTVKDSKTLRDLTPVCPAWMELWMQQWKAN